MQITASYCIFMLQDEGLLSNFTLAINLRIYFASLETVTLYSLESYNLLPLIFHTVHEPKKNNNGVPVQNTI